MRCVAVLNQKGGVGKTTTAVNLAAGLARSGRRVLLIDLDPQAHASLHVGVQLGRDEPSVYDVLLGDAPLAEVCRNIADRFTLLPASIDLVGADLELRERRDREQMLETVLRPYHDAFDYGLIDCPPALGLLTVNALAAAREVLIPLQAHFLPLQGLGRLLETVTLVREALNPVLRVAGVVLCMYEVTRLAQEVLADIEGFLAAAQPADAWHGARVCATRIRRNIKLAESPSFGKTVFDYAPGSHGAEDYVALARELVATEAPPAAPKASALAHKAPAHAAREPVPAAALPAQAEGASGP